MCRLKKMMKNAYTILNYYNAAQLSLTGQQQKY